ncbi:MAG: 16S rRNA (cytosine(1402)-N(4))-methyltransferase RsmH [Bacteroidetes bacterium]|nr:16S rRNA (cytosine(1402)-N(4))-methyltransferase RsmH [Bacteroidota bacterium]
MSKLNDREVYHVTVMLKEAVDSLVTNPSGIYVDCTLGGGGHSREILSRLDASGRLIVFDQDPQAKSNVPTDERVVFVPHNFRHLARFLKLHQVAQVHGVLADLGVSSKQFDDASRGFSIRFDGPLDMRMDPAQPKTAEWVLREFSQEQLHKMLERYGEVTNAKTLAAAIVQQRSMTPFHTIRQFKEALHTWVKGNPNKYWAQVFQALRIEVNEELLALEELLTQLPDLLLPGARAVILSFHSLEDRMVKRFFKEGSLQEQPDHPFSKEKPTSPFRVITKKPIEPGAEEIKSNSRSRSARLRIAEKK